MEKPLRDKVEEVLEEIRPLLQADGGDVELVDVSGDGIVRVRLRGACANCTGSLMTLKKGVERLVTEQIPEVREVVAL